MEKIDLVSAMKTALSDESVAKEVVGAAIKTIINGKEAGAAAESGWVGLMFNPETNDLKVRSDANMAAVAAGVYYGTQATALGSGTDLNNVVTAGVYRTNSAAITGSLANCPISGESIRMTVVSFGGDGNVRQEVLARVTIRNGTSHYVRYLGGGSWSAWYAVASAAVS